MRSTPKNKPRYLVTITQVRKFTLTVEVSAEDVEEAERIVLATSQKDLNHKYLNSTEAVWGPIKVHSTTLAPVRSEPNPHRGSGRLG